MPMTYQTIGFPLADVAPDALREVAADVQCPFRPQRLVLAGFMDVIRGVFWIKRSRLPRLNRDDVIAYSTRSRYPKRRRTVVEYHEAGVRKFVRKYQPASVVYLHTDPLSYVTVMKVDFDEVPALPSVEAGVAASVFRGAALGAGVYFPTSRTQIRLTFANRGDVPVRVAAVFHGVGY